MTIVHRVDCIKLQDLAQSGTNLLAIRALDGMQKEAIVQTGDSKYTWRMLSDEGPYLNGTDMAPFPLAYFSAGVQFSFMTHLLSKAAQLGIEITNLNSSQHNFYTMEGSFLGGTATGGALPAEIQMECGTAAEDDRLRIKQRIDFAEAYPARCLMSKSLANSFTLHFRGKERVLPEMKSAPYPLQDPTEIFNQVNQDSYPQRPEIVTKVRQGKVVHRVDGGAGSSLKAEQNRTLHIQSSAELLNGILETTVNLIKPIGSSFHFKCDAEGITAPPPSAYISAGVGFCFMTQLGRYAHILKKKLHTYSIFQRNLPHGSKLDSFDTQVFINANLSEEQAIDLIKTGERTCFLHALMRGAYSPKIKFETRVNHSKHKSSAFHRYKKIT